ncbi:hypothetical protein ACS0TY_036439 [Phlomoides rotata]
MKVIAEIFTGNLFYVEVGEDATVGDLKNTIGNHENLPSDRLILMLDIGEQQMLDKDEAPLKDYGVQDSSHVYILFHLRDSGSSASPSTPKESTSNGHSPFTDLLNDENPERNEANGPSSSVDRSSTQ